MTNSDFTARSGKTQTLGEVLEQMGYTKPESQTATQDQNLVAVLTIFSNVGTLGLVGCAAMYARSWTI